MNELFFLFAKLMPEESLTERLENALQTYKATGTEKAKTELGFYCMMWSLKQSISEKDLGEILRDAQNMEKVSRLTRFDKS